MLCTHVRTESVFIVSSKMLCISLSFFAQRLNKQITKERRLFCCKRENEMPLCKQNAQIIQLGRIFGSEKFFGK